MNYDILENEVYEMRHSKISTQTIMFWIKGEEWSKYGLHSMGYKEQWY